MASSISVRAEDRLEGATNFNVWKLRITNILQEHDLEQYVTTVVEEPTNNRNMLQVIRGHLSTRLSI
jgi:hypothetical protein